MANTSGSGINSLNISLKTCKAMTITLSITNVHYSCESLLRLALLTLAPLTKKCLNNGGNPATFSQQVTLNQIKDLRTEPSYLINKMTTRRN